MGPPIAVLIGEDIGEKHEASSLLLCYAIIIGSVMAPIGNPQNMLIAVQSGMKTPFITFFTILTIPTIISLLILGIYILKIYHVEKKVVTIAPILWRR